MKEVTLKSGAVLKISQIPFKEAKSLYQSILEEMKTVPLQGKAELGDLLKNIFCLGFSSKKVEAALWECLKRCTYNHGNGDLKIEESTFEPLKAREDYSFVCMEVIQETIAPFMKGLYAEFVRLLAHAQSFQI